MNAIITFEDFFFRKKSRDVVKFFFPHNFPNTGLFTIFHAPPRPYQSRKKSFFPTEPVTLLLQPARNVRRALRHFLHGEHVRGRLDRGRLDVSGEDAAAAVHGGCAGEGDFLALWGGGGLLAKSHRMEARMEGRV